MTILLNTIIKPEEKKKREKITEYVIYHNYDMEFLDTFDGKLDYDTMMKYDDSIFNDWYGISQTQRNFEKASAIRHLTYGEFSKTYPQFKNYVKKGENHSYKLIMPEKVEPKYNNTDILESQAEAGGYLEELLDAAEKVTENYGMQDKVDVEDIIKLLGEPFIYLRQLFTYLTVFGITITRGDCTWECIKIPRIPPKEAVSWEDLTVWCFVNLDRPIVDPTSIRYINPDG